MPDRLLVVRTLFCIAHQDGELDPALLLRFSVEKISLPCGEGIFKWLTRQTTIQQYYVYLFWLIKVKFFDRDSDPENERFLLHGLSKEYQRIMDIVGKVRLCLFYLAPI